MPRRNRVTARKDPYAVALGRRGGKAKSAAKAKSSAANGKLGGRPKKVIDCSNPPSTGTNRPTGGRTRTR